MKIPIALNKVNGHLVFIQDITKENRGLACNCVCPHCNSNLVARLGEDRTDHFAHYKNPETVGCKESALHIYGKYVISKLDYFNITPIILDGVFEDKLGRSHSITPIKIFGDAGLEIVSTNLEKKIGNIRSDVFIEAKYKSTNINLNIEIKVTNKVDSKKKGKLEKLKLNTLEIDISKLLKIPNLTFDTVKDELVSFENQKIIYISPSFKSQYEIDLNKKVLFLKDAINKKIDDWLLNTETVLRNDGLCLPRYDYSFENIPLIYEKVINGELCKEGLDKPIKTDVMVDVVCFKHIDNYMFELTLLINNKEFQLPVIATDLCCPVLDEPYLNLQSYLLFSQSDFTRFNSFIDFTWGGNQKADKFENKYNARVKELISDIKKYGANEIRNLISKSKTAIKSKNIKYCDNYSMLKQRAQFYYEELDASELFLRRANELINENSDNACIYGCEPKIWQMNLLWDLVHSKSYMIDIRMIEQRLKQLSITPVPPFKELIERSKLISKDKQSYPFTPPRILFRVYFRYLCKVGLLEEHTEDKYILLVRYTAGSGLTMKNSRSLKSL